MNKNKNGTVLGQEGEAARVESKGELKLGLDLHYRQVTVAMQENGGRIKGVGKMGREGFLSWVEGKQKEGWKLYSCYEAGASGYWLHRRLEELGVTNWVVAPRDMGRGAKRQKTDKRDSAVLTAELDSYLRGNQASLNPVAIPTVEQEQKRALIRFHRQVMIDRNRYESRGKSLLCAQGIEVVGRWWRAKVWQELQQEPGLKAWMKSQLQSWRRKLMQADKEQSQLRQRIEALAPALLPKGVGAYSAVVLEYEMKGLERFQNRRQVSSYTGLCPGIHQSNGRGREGSINRCGNRTVRWILVEAIWRLMLWQPNYRPVQALGAGLIQSKRARRRLAVKAARQLAIDLWRLAKGQTTPEKLGLIMQPIR
jgi:transposase